MNNTTRLIVGIVILGIGIWWFQQYQFSSNLVGTWKAQFPIDEGLSNVSQVKALEVTFQNNGHFVYGVESFERSVDLENGGISRGISKSKWKLEGTYKVDGRKVIVRLAKNISNFKHIDPFLVTNFGADDTTGDSFIEGAAEAQLDGLLLSLQPYKYHNKFYFYKGTPYTNKERLPQLPNRFLENLQNPPENRNPNRVLSPSHSNGIKMKRMVGEIGDQYQYKKVDRETPHYEPYVPSPKVPLTPQEIVESKKVDPATLTDSQVLEAKIIIESYYRELGITPEEEAIENWLNLYKNGTTLADIKQYLISSSKQPSEPGIK